MAQDLAREFVADLYRRERSGMARSVARIAGESHAEDLVHDAFVAYLTKSPWATRPGAWVATVARNRALNELRRPRLVPLTGIEFDDDAPSPESEREAIRVTVAAALEAIPARSLTALRMKFFDGCDYPEVARALGVRVAQAHVIVHRALRRLGRELVNRMAAAHGASDCAPALLRMAGLGTGEDAHDADPCPLCRPAWDEIVALRIGGWIPLPLLALRGKIRAGLENLAGRITGRGPLAADAVNRAATAFVALGIAAASVAPVAAAAPSAPQRRAASIERPAAGPGDAGAVAPVQVSKPKPAPPARRADQPRSPGGVQRGPVNVQPPEDDGTGHAGHDDVGSVLLCTDVTQPCEPPPPGGAYS